MGFLLFAVVLIIICCKNRLWKKWKEHYPTILYLFTGSVVCHLLVYQKPLWDFCELFYKYPILNIAMSAVLYPPTVILFLSSYPRTFAKQVLHNLLWIVLYSSVEYISFLLGDFIYFNEWTIFYTILFNMVMFPLISLHHKKPLLTWPISAALAFLFIWYFQIPIIRM